jgi:hypothetical protein
VNFLCPSDDSFTEKICTSGRTITLAFDNPEIKPIACLELVEKLSALHDTVYLDYDLQLSSFLQNLNGERFDRICKNGKLTVIQPPDDVLSFVELISGEKIGSGGTIIIDSLNTLQTLLTDQDNGRSSKIANQKTAIVITVLQQIVRFYYKSLVIVNVAKSRPKRVSESTESYWEKVLVGGRMIKYKSDAILSVKRGFAGGVPRIEIREQQYSSGMRDSALTPYVL